MRLPEAARTPWGATQAAGLATDLTTFRGAGRSIERRARVFSSLTSMDTRDMSSMVFIQPQSSSPGKVSSDTATGEVSHVGMTPRVMLRLMLVLVLPLSWGATAVRKSLSICNSFKLGMVILLDLGLVLQGPPGLEIESSSLDPAH